MNRAQSAEIQSASSHRQNYADGGWVETHSPDKHCSASAAPDSMARIEARLGNIELALMEKTTVPAASKTPQEVGEDERVAVELARKELASAQREAHMEQLLANRQRGRKKATLHNELEKKRVALCSSLPAPSIGSRVHVILGPSSGSCVEILHMIRPTKFRTLNALVTVARETAPAREISSQELNDTDRSRKIRQIMRTFLDDLRGGDSVLQGIRGDPLRRPDEPPLCTVVEVLRFDDEVVGARFDTDEGLLTYVHSDEPSASRISLHPDVVFEYDDEQFSRLLALLRHNNGPKDSDSSENDSSFFDAVDLWPYKVRLSDGDTTWLREADVVPCCDKTNEFDVDGTASEALQLAEQLRTLDASVDAGLTPKESDLWARVCQAEAALVHTLASAAASGSLSARKALIEELSVQIDERRETLEQQSDRMSAYDADGLAADIREMSSRRGALRDSLPRFKELHDMSMLLETALDGIRNATKKLGHGAHVEATTHLRKSLQSSASAVLGMPTLVKALDQVAAEKRKASTRAHRSMPDLLLHPERSWTCEFAMLSGELAERRAIMNF